MSTVEDATGRSQDMVQRYARVRAQTLALTEGLTPEDCMVQSMTEASPVKWHLAHVTWFFETLVLEAWLPRLGKTFTPFRPEFRVLFNSYYIGLGEFHARPERGALSRPSFADVLAYRRAIDEQMAALLSYDAIPDDLLGVVELGLHHEQQHQELILTDLKHHFSRNPMLPVYRTTGDARMSRVGAPMRFVALPGDLVEIGHGGADFAFDNECPRHRVWLDDCYLASRLVTNGEYLQFIRDGGYAQPALWLSDGWDWVRREKVSAPLYWLGNERQFTLSGEREIDGNEPVCHVSYYEADAYARWAGARLATEAEWEHAAELKSTPQEGNYLEDGIFHPAAATVPSAAVEHDVAQLFGDTWEWTQSAYLPYSGFKTAKGPASEYNGKFMINQMVLRGGSRATPRDHIRASYRNFFHPWARWQFSGIRLVRESR